MANQLRQDDRFSELSFRRLMARLAGHISVYGGGFVLSRISVLLLAPVYLRLLTPADFGILSLARIAPTFVMVFVTLDLHGTIIRFYYDWKKQGCEREAIFSIWLFSLIWGGAVTFACLFFGEKVFVLLFRQVSFHPYIRLALLAEVMNLTGLIARKLMRIKENVKMFAATSVISTVLNMSLIIFFLVYLKKGVAGALLGTLVANSIMLVPYSIYLAINSRLRISLFALRESLAYALPLVPSGFVNNVYIVLDRFFLDKFVPASQIGLYAVGRTIASLISMIVDVFQLGMMPFYLRTALERSDCRVIIGRSFQYFMYILLLLGLSISTFAPEIILVLGKTAYADSSRFVGPLVLAFILGVIPFISRVQVCLVRKTKYISIVEVTRFVIFASVGYLLILTFGTWGAIISYIMTNLVALFLFLIIGHKCYPIDMPVAKVGVVAAVTLIFGLSSHFYNMTLPGSFSLNTMLLKFSLILICATFMMAIEFPSKSASMMKNIVRQLKSA